MTKQVLIAGCGDTGRSVTRRLLADGAQVTGLVRSAESASKVDALGAQAMVCDLDGETPKLGGLLPTVDLIYYFAPPPREGESDPRLERFLEALGPARPQRFIYISTSGVYGHRDGAWVDETTPVNPQTDRATRRVAAENSLQSWAGAWIIMRAPGIYGPGRLPLEKVRAGEPVLRDEDCGWSNRIHIEDLARAAILAATQGPDQTIYNVTDGNPTKMAAYYGAMAKLLELPAPRQIDWATAEREFSAMRLSFLKESRRVSNQRLREQLGLELLYADLEQGLKASLADQQ